MTPRETGGEDVVTSFMVSDLSTDLSGEAIRRVASSGTSGLHAMRRLRGSSYYESMTFPAIYCMDLEIVYWLMLEPGVQGIQNAKRPALLRWPDGEALSEPRTRGLAEQARRKS